MHVQFEFTQEALIDVSDRLLARSKVVRVCRWKGLLYTAFLAWLLVFLFFSNTPLKGLIVGLVAALVSALIFPSVHKSGVEKRLRRFHQEKLGDANSFICEVELTPVGVWVRQMNKQIMHEWESVEEIKESEDSVDIFTREGGGVIVRKRAFKSSEDLEQFIGLAQSYLEVCRVGGSDGAPQLTTH
jgi:hypothetical protein